VQRAGLSSAAVAGIIFGEQTTVIIAFATN